MGKVVLWRHTSKVHCDPLIHPSIREGTGILCPWAEAVYTAHAQTK